VARRFGIAPRRPGDANANRADMRRAGPLGSIESGRCQRPFTSMNAVMPSPRLEQGFCPGEPLTSSPVGGMMGHHPMTDGEAIQWRA
jgi:hypothetical protein